VAEITPADDVAATPETEAVTLAKIVPTEEISDHEPRELPDACVAVTVPALEVAVCPTKDAVEFVLTENAPVELVAAEPAIVLPLEGLVVPCAVAAEAPIRAAVTPLDEVTVPADIVAEIAVTAMDAD
jgi:hypothetical protein